MTTPDDEGTEALLSAWGGHERELRRVAETETLIAAGLAVQARRRGLRRGLMTGLVLLALAGAFLGGRLSAPESTASETPSVSNPELPPVVPRVSRPLVESTPALDEPALEVELDAYLETGARRHASYARAAEAWLEQEADVLSALRCLERIEREGETPPADDPRWNNWLFVALQRDVN